MVRRKIVFGLVVCLLTAMLIGQSLSQPGQRGQRGQRTGGQDRQDQGAGGRQFDPERMRQMMEQRMKEMLNATDEEWKVLGPYVIKVQELSRQVGGGGRGGMMSGRGGRGPGGNQTRQRQGAQNRELTDVEKIQEQLQTLLENTEATPEKIKELLTKLRGAKEKAKQELAKAQQDLRKILTLRREAQLVLMGLLD